MIQTNSKSTIVNRKFLVLPLQDEEREALRPRERPSLLEWLETKYMLAGGTAAVEGLWSREYTPYFVPVAEWLGDTTTREVWIYGCSQMGKSTFGTGFVGYIVDCDPGPTLLIMPTKPDVQNRVESRIRPMFGANPELLAHVRGRRVTNIFIGKQTVMDHMNLYIGWPTTAQALADKPVCYIVADETGKWPPYVGDEADPVSLMRSRPKWFKSRSKILGMTTPVSADDLSDENFNRGDRCEWWAKCPHCRKCHRFVWENVQIDRKADKTWYAESVYRKGGHARYVCPKCGASWSEHDRWQAALAARAVPADCLLSEDGELIGEPGDGEIRSLRIPGLMLHPMVETVTNLVVLFVRAQKAKLAGNIQPLKDFWNSYLARSWREDRATTPIEVLKRHVGSYPAMKVPAGAAMLTAGLDVQLDHVWIKVNAWGYLGEWWTVLTARIETGPTERVENLVNALLPYLTMRFELLADSKKVMRISLSGIDRQYNADAVDAFCLRCRAAAPIVPMMGDDKLSRQMQAVSKAAGGVLKLYRLNVTAYKDALHRGYFEAAEPGPGYGHLHADTEYVVLEHLTSEKKIIKRKGDRIVWIGWVNKKTHPEPNHLWDCDVMARAAAELAGLWTLADPSKPKKDVTFPGKPVGKKPIRTEY